MIFDSHCHITPHGYTSVKYNYYMEQLAISMSEASVNKAIVMLNPFVKELMCEPNHRVRFIGESKGGRLECLTCGKLLLRCKHDPYRLLNLSLLSESRKLKGKVYPFVYLTTCASTFQQEIDYFEYNHFDEFYGFKFISTFNMVSVCQLKGIRTNKPLLFHTKNDIYADAMNVINVTQHLSTPVILAHFCSFNDKALEYVNQKDSIYYTDISPLLDLKNNYESRNNLKIYPVWNNYSQFSFESFIKRRIESLNPKKILFGTDTPWGNMKSEVQYFLSLDLPKYIIDNICCNNFNVIVRE